MSGSGINIGFIGLLSLILITLKVLGKITISWVWVLSPLWISAIVCIIAFIIFIAIVVATMD